MNEPATALHQYVITVLLVDDQPIVANAVRAMLAEEKDIVFHYCQDPAKAVTMAVGLGPTVILQDLVMPDIDGLTLCRFFRSHPRLKDVPLIVLSSKEEAITKAEAFAQGANDYLVKLPDKIELIARIRYHSRGYINLLQRNDAYQALLNKQRELAAELSRAADYVVSLLPAPVVEGPVRTEWRFVPSAHLGGDSFGYHWIDPDHFAVYLLDVCGHGVGSALMSVSALNSLRLQALPGVDFLDPAQVLAGLNETYQMDNHNGLYFTIWYGVFQKSTRTIRFAAAGHPPAVLLEPGSSVPRELLITNMIIGGIPGMAYDAKEAQLGPDDRLYIFSDGAYEVTRPDGTMWDLDGFKKFLAEASAREGSEIESLYRHVIELRGDPVLEDDFSMLKVTFG